MVEWIMHDEIQLAMILRANTAVNGIEFFTHSNATLQVGQMKRPAGYVITPHVHVPVDRTVSYTQEVLFIKSGRVQVDFYSEQRQLLESRELVAGDIVLLSRGGHGFQMLEPTEIVEVKQGPYVGEGDKIRFTSATSSPENKADQ